MNEYRQGGLCRATCTDEPAHNQKKETMRYFIFGAIVVVGGGLFLLEFIHRSTATTDENKNEIIWHCDLGSLKTKKGEMVADCVAQPSKEK
jgi:hypothetical protein